MDSARLLLDTDVVINWLIKETESVSGKELWKAPYEIVKLVENNTLMGTISLTIIKGIERMLALRVFQFSTLCSMLFAVLYGMSDFKPSAKRPDEKCQNTIVEMIFRVRLS